MEKLNVREPMFPPMDLLNGMKFCGTLMIKPNPEFSLDSLFAYWKKKVFKEKAWGLRQSMKESGSNFKLSYQLLNSQLKSSEFNQVR